VRLGLLESPREIEYVIDALRAAAGDARHVMGETMPGQLFDVGPEAFRRDRRHRAVQLAVLAVDEEDSLCARDRDTFVLKPSEETPISGALIADLFDEAGLPAGVLNVVPGVPAAVGDRLIADPRVRMITFTGSTRTGRHLAAEAARHLKKFTLEMGGKSPLVVLKDADIDYAVDAAAFGVFLHQGQVCMASSKVIVEAPLFDTFVDKFKAKTAAIKVGDPRDPETVICPLFRSRQCGFIDSQLKDATEKGAKIVAAARMRETFFSRQC
jgi:vanillin dehydrogenase